MYIIPSSGYYFIYISVGVPAYYTRLNIALRNASTTFNLLLAHAYDIQYISKGRELYISTEYPLYRYSVLQTSWSGFKQGYLMSPLILFRVARTSRYNSINFYIPFDQLIINVGQG